jgi:heat-inducible transcriptional repressor
VRARLSSIRHSRESGNLVFVRWVPAFAGMTIGSAGATSPSMTQPISELTDRMREIFGLVVESYLERGLPIGSKVLAGSVSLSPASIRGVMQELEERGLLTHPHTSAGRIPTESGLRLFVDGIMQTAAPDQRERREIERQIARDQPIEDALTAATAALSGLSQAAGVVLAPKQELRLRQLSFVPLSDTRALAVLVGVDGSVENRVVPLDGGTTPAALTEVSNFINARLSGLTLAEAEARLRAEIRDHKEAIDAAAAELVASGLAAWSQDHARRPVLIVRGQANLIDEAAAEDLERVRRLLDELEDRQEIARLLEGARDAPGCRIFIGSENRMFALSGSSVIAAPYRGSQGQVVGVVGVIGPTRLNYARVVPMVDFTAKALTRLMA